MPGASKNARPVKIMNANWKSGRNGDDGQFELMLVTSALIAANLRGTMPWTEHVTSA